MGYPLQVKRKCLWEKESVAVTKLKKPLPVYCLVAAEESAQRGKMSEASEKSMNQRAEQQGEHIRQQVL